MFDDDYDWIEAAAKRFELDVGYASDPVLWINDVLGERLWSRQNDIAKALIENNRVAVRACHGVGKSWIASRIMAWWIATRPPGEAFVVSTAPTFAQVRAILWRELNKAYSKAEQRGYPLPGRMNQTEWLIGNELIAYGRKPQDMDPAAFQGIHAKHVLVVLDEACGIPEALWIATDALATGEYCRILAIGNPDDPTSHFADVCGFNGKSTTWKVLHLNAWDSPNLTGEQVSQDMRDVLVSRRWVEEKKEEWGEDSPWYFAKVLGEFPMESEDNVVKLSDVKKCQEEKNWPADELLPVELGLDVGAGGDETVVFERRGPKAGKCWRRKTTEPEQVISLVLNCIVETGATAIKVDSIGVGWGIAGRLEELYREGRHKCKVFKVDVRKQPSTDKNKQRFTALRDELWWEVGRVQSEKRLWDLSGVDEKTLVDLTSAKFELTITGKVKVEAKDDMKERIGRSPDSADALLLAFYSARGHGAAWMEYLERQLEAAA